MTGGKPFDPNERADETGEKGSKLRAGLLSLLAHTAVQDQDDETNGSGWMRHGPVQAELPPPPIRKGVFT
jgi:hypothetical protein